MKRTDPDIIGTPPPLDLGPLFNQAPSVEEAEAEIRRDFLEREAPEAEEPPFEKPAPRGNPFRADRLEARETIKRIVGPRILERALARVDRRTEPGVTADDVRELAQRAGLAHALGDEQRAWSWVASWLKQLVKAGYLVEYRIDGQLMRRPSTREDAHGNPQAIYLHPSDYRARAIA